MDLVSRSHEKAKNYKRIMERRNYSKKILELSSIVNFTCWWLKMSIPNAKRILNRIWKLTLSPHLGSMASGATGFCCCFTLPSPTGVELRFPVPGTFSLNCFQVFSGRAHVLCVGPKFLFIKLLFNHLSSGL